MLDDKFMTAASKLYVPEMGTESVAPLLYWLVRMLRPARVLEIGMGYTTPFLARAIADNIESERIEEEALASASPAELPKPLRSYYEVEHRHRLVCVDRMADTSSSAPRAWQTLVDLQLDGHCTVIESDLSDSAPAVIDELGTVDFAWVDTWDTLAFVRNYWHLLSTEGGVLAVHYLMSYPEGRAVQSYLESLRAPDGGRLEMINLLEPHKYAQNSLTLLRRIRDFVEPEDLRPQGSAHDLHGVLTRERSRSAESAPSEG